MRRKLDKNFQNSCAIFLLMLVSDPGVTHVPWCMPGSLTSGFLWIRWRENFPGIPGACAIRNITCLVRGQRNIQPLQICHFVTIYRAIITGTIELPSLICRIVKFTATISPYDMIVSDLNNTTGYLNYNSNVPMSVRLSQMTRNPTACSYFYFG